MQTQCPHCDTKFRVTEAQVQAADGFVRCGVCSEVFNAIEIASQDKHQVSLLEDVAAKVSATEEQSAAVTEENENIEASTIEALPDDAAVNFNESTSADEPGKDPFDFFNEESNESLQHVVPEKFRDSYSSQTPSTASTALWSIGILLLTATLIIEYIWFNRDQLNKIPELQGAINTLCQQFKCKDFSIRDPANIELITRNVFSHPNEKGALMVNVTMKNNATFAQPYPVIQIDFSDIRGNSVAARRFWPKEYLASEYQQGNAKQPNLLQANTNASITLEIQDPGKQAMTYEFNFL
jgi:predicted Zn finger-like uncharacterized protein